MCVIEALKGEKVRFVCAASLCVAIYYFFLYTLTEWWEWHYIVSATAAMIIYIVVGYILQKWWVFQNYTMKYFMQRFIEFSIIVVVNWLINTALMHAMVVYWGWYFLHAQMALTLIVAPIAYVVFRKIFADKEAA